MHVLMVDDETEFLEIMKKRLGRRSMDITTASNGMDGLKCVQAMTDGTGSMWWSWTCACRAWMVLKRSER